MAGDNKTYGFSKADAEALALSIGSLESEFPEIRARGSGIKLVRFSLLASLTSGTASATIKNMAGTTIETADVLDPEGIFAELTTSDTGLALRQAGIYYVIQAACP